MKIVSPIIVLIAISFVLAITIFYKNMDMKQKNIKIFFITGTSGSGKSTLMYELKKLLPRDCFEVYDFDENGVPSDADETWRKNTTDSWLTKAQENSLNGKSTVICGVSVPSEIIDSPIKPDAPLYFGFIRISDDLIKQRLKMRAWDEKRIQDNINWAHYLEAQVKNQKNHFIVDGSHDSPESVARTFINWITQICHLQIDHLNN